MPNPERGPSRNPESNGPEKQKAKPQPSAEERKKAREKAVNELRKLKELGIDGAEGILNPQNIEEGTNEINLDLTAAESGLSKLMDDYGDAENTVEGGQSTENLDTEFRENLLRDIGEDNSNEVEEQGTAVNMTENLDTEFRENLLRDIGENNSGERIVSFADQDEKDDYQSPLQYNEESGFYEAPEQGNNSSERIPVFEDEAEGNEQNFVENTDFIRPIEGFRMAEDMAIPQPEPEKDSEAEQYLSPSEPTIIEESGTTSSGENDAGRGMGRNEGNEENPS